MKLSLTVILLCLIASNIKGQDLQDTRVVGIVAFSSGRTQDSLAAKDVNATASRVLVQTQRFTVLDLPSWEQTIIEKKRQQGEQFLLREIIEQGKSLGAKILVIGTVKNAEIYQENSHYAARVDYDVKFVDVESGKSVTANSFKGDSEGLANVGSKISKGINQLLRPAMITGNGSWRQIAMTGAVFSALSEADKNAIMGKLIDAIESTAASMNAWIRSTFNINLLCLTALDEDSRRGYQHILIEGGENINMVKGTQLRLVLINQIESSRGKIQDEVPVAEMEVEEVRAQTTLCKVTEGGKKIEAGSVRNYRVIFKQLK